MDVPDWLDRLVMSCLEKDPDKRPQSMEAVARSLAAEAALEPGGNAPAAGKEIVTPTEPMPSLQVVSTETSTPGEISTEATVSSNPALGRTGRRARGHRRRAGAPRSRSSSPAPSEFSSARACSRSATLRKSRRCERPAAAPPATAPTRFALRIESIPGGAKVLEGDRVLGMTPLELSVDNDAVRGAPRSFVLAKDGFASYAITQGPSADAVRIVAPLVPAPAVAGSSVATRATLPPAVRPPHASPERAPERPASKPHADCDPPFTLDEAGHKHFKLECL